MTVPTASAEALIRNGNFLAAAQEYARLASSGNAESPRYKVLAALAYNDAGDPTTAREFLVDPPSANSSVLGLHNLALAATDTLGTGSEFAQAQIANVDFNLLTPYQRNVYQRTEGRIALNTGNFAKAAEALIAADAYALPSANRAALHNDIWAALSRLNDKALNETSVGARNAAGGWYDLARAARPNLHDSAALASAVEAWRIAHAQHAANLTLVEQLFEISESLTASTRHVALLLPFEGSYASAAAAVRDGFMSAWYDDSRNTARPVVSVYSASTQNINEIYDIAVANGADLVVGPLEKPALEALLGRGDLPVRTLALNSTSSTSDATGAGDANFFQFDLAPEDEAAAAAERAWADGHVRLVSMVPASPWGERVANALNDRWQALGGTVLNRVSYGGKDSSFAGAVKEALNIDLSVARAEALRAALGRPIHYEPRRRADVDAIFLAGFPVSARQVLPQFRYFRAESVPMYATSHTYTGRANAGADQDLDGLRFGDMPWLFGKTNRASYDLFKRNWPKRAAGEGRLYAFGLDAYQVLSYLARMRHQPTLSVPGNTGVLRMDSSGHIHRDLSWARFSGGIPRLLDR